MDNDKDLTEKDSTAEDSLQEESSTDQNSEKGSRRRKGVENALKDADKRLEESSKSIFASTFSVFYPAHYDEEDIPESQIDVDEEGNEYVEPLMVKPWVCRYYYSPERKARLARHSAYAMAMIVVAVAPFFLGIPGGIGATVLGFLLLLNFQFRYRDIALWKWPMPEIPFLSQLDIGSAVNEAKERSTQALREQEEYENMVEEGTSLEYIEPVDDYREGNPSPATILTNWMNISAQMDKEDFIDASDGRINNFTMELILKDNEGAWKDPTILDTISYITKTNAQDWLDAFELWNASEEE